MNQKNIIYIAVAIAVLALVGGGYWFLQSSGNQSAKNQEAINNVEIKDLKLDFSLSPMPELNLSSFNLNVPQFSGTGIFAGASVDTDFSYKGDTKLSAPSYTLNVSIPSNIPTSAPTSIPTGAPASTGAPTTTPTSAPAQTGAPAGQTTDCSSFSSVPSCSMVGGGEAYNLCKQCFPGK